MSNTDISFVGARGSVGLLGTGASHPQMQDAATLDRIERSLMSIETLLRGSGTGDRAVFFPGIAVGPFVAGAARQIGILSIDGPANVKADVNVEKKLTFKVTEFGFGGSQPVNNAKVTFVLGLSQGAGLSKTKGGKATKKIVKVKTNKKGVATAYLLGGLVETVTVTGQTPGKLTTLEDKTVVTIK